jgi:hypothetical protein
VIRRDLQVAGSETTITTASEEVHLIVGRRGMTVTGVAAVSESAAVRRALDLLARVSVPLESPMGQALMATRAMLLSAVGDRAAARAVFARGRVALEDAGGSSLPESDDDDELNPTECWNTYAREAIAAATDFDNCLDDCAWYNAPCEIGCQLVYDMRAIGAMAWWMRCVGLGISG